MKYSSVPVFMYHNVGVINEGWLWNHLTCPWELFESHLQWLKRMKIHTISLQELYEYKKGDKKIPSNSIVITFDDGYLDNWVFAYPLLKKYGFKGTIFVSPEFVDPRSILRKNLEDVWKDNSSVETLECHGFLSWEEMKVMEDQGVIDIQSHSMSHTWYFISDRIIDFHHPGNNKYPWIFWNASPERKVYYLNEEHENLIPYGMPIYENGRSLGIKRYFEDKRLNEFLVDVAGGQGKDFFSRKDWRNSLLSQSDLFRSKNKINDRYESDKEQEDRYRHELMESKKMIESKLRKDVKFFCWPGGAKTDLSVKVCFNSGYLSYTVSSANNNGRNSYPEDPTRIYRIGAPNIQHKGKMFYLGGFSFIIWFYAFRRNLIARMMKKMIRMSGVLAIILGKKKNLLLIR